MGAATNMEGVAKMKSDIDTNATHAKPPIRYPVKEAKNAAYKFKQAASRSRNKKKKPARRRARFRRNLTNKYTAPPANPRARNADGEVAKLRRGGHTNLHYFCPKTWQGIY